MTEERCADRTHQKTDSKGAKGSQQRNRPIFRRKELAGDDRRDDARDVDAAPLDERQKMAMVYARALTNDPGGMQEEIVHRMRDVGWDDGEILEINQVSAYFNYANRTVLGLGCSTKGDILGLSPNKSADQDDWSHS